MLLVKVEIPFHRRETDTDQVHGDLLKVSEEELARIRAVNINMVSVLGEAEDPEREDPNEADPETKDAELEETVTEMVSEETVVKSETRKKKQ